MAQTTGAPSIEQEIINARKRYGDPGASQEFADTPTYDTELMMQPMGYGGYPGYTDVEGNYGGFAGVSGEGTPNPSPQQIEDRANWRLQRSAEVRGGLREGGADPRMLEVEKAIASLRALDPSQLATGLQFASGFQG